jgi:hypothetical protein
VNTRLAPVGVGHAVVSASLITAAPANAVIQSIGADVTCINWRQVVSSRSQQRHTAPLTDFDGRPPAKENE